ncbi:Nramp family divalent metal transporter [Sediminibacillus massiliensis]|uniref:Nramp family divalent metal transporter n=1 Tax=Sediminibacillus massiliensis TaxID=1926277 RepID=UPI000988605B|nr:Nramp family divalent metal transporter [Sediminibacillus massiliensis]
MSTSTERYLHPTEEVEVVVKSKPEQKAWWQAIGPGSIIAAAIVGPGTVTTVSVAGASYGFQVAWILVLACVIGFYLQKPVLKWTIATRTSVLEGIRDEINGVWAKFIFLLLWLGALAFQAGNFIGASMAMSLLAPDVSMTAWVTILSGMALLVAWIGKYKLLENINRTIIGLLVLTFCITALTSTPSLGQFLSSGFAFRVPEADFWIVLALVATIMVPNTLVALSGFTKKKYQNENHLNNTEKLKLSFIDLRVNFTITAIIALSILISAGTAIFGTGIVIESAGDMAMQLAPVAGQFAGIFFALGLFTAGFSSGLFNLTVQPMLFGEAFNASEDRTSKMNRGILVLTAIIPVLLVFFFGGAPVQLIITAQAVNGLILPLLAGTIFVLINKKDRMGTFKNSKAGNILYGSIVFVVFLLAVRVFVDIFGLI